MSLEEEQAHAALFDAAADALQANDAAAREHEIHYMLITKMKGRPFAMATNVEPDVIGHFLDVFKADTEAAIEEMKKAYALTNRPADEPPEKAEAAP